MNTVIATMTPEVVACYPKPCLRLALLLIVLKPYIRGTSNDKPGCYRFYHTPPIPHISADLPDHALCRMWCGAFKGPHKAGLSDGSRCSCYLPGLWQPVLQRSYYWRSGCNITCPGRPHQSCGGKHAATFLMDVIYPELPNCFSGFRETLGRDAYLNNKYNTRARCQKKCSEMGYPFAAVWGILNCWCADSFFGLQLLSGMCNLPCPGNTSEQCGGVMFAWLMKSDAVMDVTCLKDQHGLNYRGRVSVAALDQRPCTQWSQVIADIKRSSTSDSSKENRDWIKGYDEMGSQDRNTAYCRNIDNDKNGPWCFTTSTNSSFRWTKSYCYIPICPSEVEKPATKEPCTRKLFGMDYIGSKTTTSKGERCRRWSHPEVVQRLHETQRGEWAFNQMPVHVQRSNLCRNADLSTNGPWCYIDSKFPEWGYCGIKECPNVKNLGCTDHLIGRAYNGPVNIAFSGKKCLVWSSLEVQRLIRNNIYLDFYFTMWPKEVQLTNVCRNPAGAEGGPWCYVEGKPEPFRQNCTIDMCPTWYGKIAEFGGIGQGGQLRSNTQIFLYLLVCILVYWKL